MDQDKMSTDTRSALRKLANQIWEQELTSELAKVREAFDAMAAGTLAPVAVAEVIHEFHEEIYKKLLDINQSHEPVLLLGRAVVKGLVTEDDIPEEARELVRKAILFYRNKTTVFEKGDVPSPPGESPAS